MKYFVVFLIVALAAMVSAQPTPVRSPAVAPEESDIDPAELEIPAEAPRDKRGLGFGFYAGFPGPYYGGYRTYYRSPYSYYPYAYGIRKNYGYWAY